MSESAEPAKVATDRNDFFRVWDIYDDYRTSLFNEKYFERKLSDLQSKALYFDIFVAVGTSSTGIAGWALWSQPQFAILWACFAGTAITMTIVKPILRWDDRLVQLAKLFNDHCKISTEYKSIVQDLSFQQRLTPNIITSYNQVIRATAAIQRVPQGPKKLLKEIQDEVTKQQPVDRFWSPPKPNNGAAHE